MNFATFTSGGRTYTAAEQAAAFENIINLDSYLSKHRGEYAQRGAVFLPMVNRIDLSLIQDLFFKTGSYRQGGQIRLDITNFGNLLNSNWGVGTRLVNNQILTSPTADSTGALTYRMQLAERQLDREPTADLGEPGRRVRDDAELPLHVPVAQKRTARKSERPARGSPGRPFSVREHLRPTAQACSPSLQKRYRHMAPYDTMGTCMQPLPVDAAIDDVRAALARHRAAALVASPGAGKTTRVPPALLDAGPLILLQPRRVAARAIARRIADERHWRLGGEVGWHIRFERRASRRHAPARRHRGHPHRAIAARPAAQ